MIRRQRIADSFSAAAQTYENAAQLQAQSAEKLAARVLSLPLPPHPSVLEIGCGTGLLTRRLLPILGGDWTVTDISAAMVATAQAKCPAATYGIMDGEHPDVAPASMDLIISNLAAQWFADLPGALIRLAACLRPNGRLILTTLGEASFDQWRRAHTELGLTCGISPYPKAAALAAQIPGSQVSSDVIAVRYQDGLDFVHSLKTIGAATPTTGHRPLSPKALKQVMAKLGSPATITYEILTVECAPS